MKHREFKEWLHLSAIGELNGDEQELLDIHLRGCAECRAELATIASLGPVVAGHKPAEISEELLREARQQLRTALLHLRLKRSPLERIRDFALDFVSREYRLVLGGLAMSVLGLLIGFVIFTPRHVTDIKTGLA